VRVEDVIQFLESKGFANLYAYHMPDSPDDAIMVEVRGAPNSSVALAYDNHVIHLIVRGPAEDPRIAEDVAMRLYRTLHGLDGEIVGTRYVTATWGTPPVPIGQDPAGRYEFSLNVQVEVYVPDDYTREG